MVSPPSSLGFRTDLGQNGLVAGCEEGAWIRALAGVQFSVWHVLGEPLRLYAAVALPPPLGVLCRWRQ